MEQLDLSVLARQVSEPFAARAEQAGLVFEVVAPEGPVLLPGNPARLALALSNLLENALKFNGYEGTIVLTVKPEGERVKITVEDSGGGIPAEDLPLLFERFHRGRNASNYPGSGLGLAIVRAVAVAHGGSVHGANRSEGGARVWIELPCAR